MPAVVKSVKEPKHKAMGDPRVTLGCLDDKGNETKSYEDELGAVRSKRAWLPPRR